MNRLARLIRTTLLGAAAGTVILGIGGRAFMALIMLASGGDAGFPTLDWMTYPGFALLCILFGSALNSLRGKQPRTTTKGEN